MRIDAMATSTGADTAAGARPAREPRPAAAAVKTLVEVAAYPPPMGAWSQRIEFVAAAWRARGHRCVLMNIGPSRKLEDPRYLNVRGAWDFVRQVLKAAARGHTIHTHTNAKGVKGTLLALAAQLIAFPFGRRCVLTFHAGLKQEYFPRTGRLFLDSLLWLTFRTPRAVICNSPEMKRRIALDYGVAEERIHAIPAFCPAYMETEIGPLPAAVAAFAARHRPLLVSYVYFFHPEFAADLMIRAAGELRRSFSELGLVIMGSKQYAEDYLPLIDELGLAEHILLAGNLPRSEFLAVLRAAALYLRTPLGDGVASSVLEALSLGVPVVASDNGTRPPGCVLFRPGDLEDMVEKLSHVLRHRDEVAARIVKPAAGDSLADEVELLLSS
jgi:glycosyltransferase involved in cell wall biosynthesis